MTPSRSRVRTGRPASRSRTSSARASAWCGTRRSKVGPSCSSTTARYYEYIPLDIADRSLSSSQASISGLHQCNPLQVGRTVCDANTRTDGQSFITGVTQAPNRKWVTAGAPYAAYVDPDLKSPAIDEIVAGAEYEVLAQRTCSA